MANRRTLEESLRKNPQAFSVYRIMKILTYFCRVVDHRYNTEKMNMSIVVCGTSVHVMHMSSISGWKGQRRRTAKRMAMNVMCVGGEAYIVEMISIGAYYRAGHCSKPVVVGVRTGI